jgi:hypothetical protein
MEVLNVIIQALIAIGTIAVAAAAIWGEWFRSKLAPARLALIEYTSEGDPTTFASGTRVMWYQLKVINQHRWLPAQNCRVMLIGYSRRDPSGIFQPASMSVPSQFTWAPSEIMPPMVTILREQVVDLGYVEERGNRFNPRLYWMSNNFQGFVYANEGVRYHLQIEAVNFLSPIYVVEVAWDGQWSDVPAQMRQHLPIRIIPT